MNRGGGWLSGVDLEFGAAAVGVEWLVLGGRRRVSDERSDVADAAIVAAAPVARSSGGAIQSGFTSEGLEGFFRCSSRVH